MGQPCEMPSVPDLDRRKPTTGEAGDGEPIGNSVRSFQSKVPLSERSATSAITMHSNSYSYLTERAYDYFKARSAWVRRTQSDGEDGASEEAAIKVEIFSTSLISCCMTRALPKASSLSSDLVLLLRMYVADGEHGRGTL